MNFDIRPYLNPDDPWPETERPEDVQRCYEFKFGISRLLRPKSILEIGVRYGYSAAAFLSGSPGAEYVGLDADNSTYGGTGGAYREAEKMLREHFGPSIVIIECDTQKSRPYLEKGFDLVHVDGDHSRAGCLSDLRLAVAMGAKMILVDDITHPPDPGVAEAVAEFLAETGYQHIYFLDTLRGDCLIRVSL
jgi:predicted O-methyltransferase YrrM